jgi:hypothetical protein
MHSIRRTFSADFILKLEAKDSTMVNAYLSCGDLLCNVAEPSLAAEGTAKLAIEQF